MSDRRFWVFCDDNCKFEAMTKEQVLNAIAEATGQTITDIDEAFITKIKEQNGNRNLKFWIGTKAQYNAIQTPDNDVAYIITDDDPLEDITESLIDIYQKLSTIDDYVYFTYVVNGWAVRKWVSGKIEAEKTITQNIERLSYPPIARSNQIRINYPSDVFTNVSAVPTVNINDVNSWIGGVSFGSNDVAFYIYSATTGTQNTKITIKVVGE